MVADLSLSLRIGACGEPGLGPAAEALFFASPKKSAQKKGEPDALSLRFAAGTLRCSVRAGSAQTCPLRGLRTCAALIRPALRYSPAHDGGKRERMRGPFLRRLCGYCPHPSPLPEGEGVKTRSPEGQSAPDPALCRQGRAEQRRGAGIRHSRVRRPRSGQVCECPPRTEQRKEPRSGPGFGSPFFCLLFFGEAKKSESAAGPRPGLQRQPTRLTTRTNP